MFSTNIDVTAHMLEGADSFIGRTAYSTLCEASPLVATDLRKFVYDFNETLAQFAHAGDFAIEDRKIAELYEQHRDVKSYCRGVNAHAENNYIGIVTQDFADGFRKAVYTFLEEVYTERRNS